MRSRSFLPVLFLFVMMMLRGKAGLVPGEKQCISLKGICKDLACTSSDDTIGVCNDVKKCCRKWWVFEPYPTPVPKGKSP
ncbi:beta-defensin 130B isoform X1 [Mus musculus]|uniref:Beta-defensin 41 n=2 Tax=Mus TaxID=862507 RepID=Q30KN1_MOUSE|nr:beta-defensin 130B precursor [Mus musculus]XP_017171607.1 beta-defensin 130B isoform X1 [Mus musculus]XP_030103775.1 beta-defensin 130B isoform X1 [Mus musculus]XP_030103776.1 beta-defensin 130B isoform X1 [Mus musculus]AAI32605.1 Predicted gene, EG654465 [Mus musculus]AAI32607.1 Predicted gene, EG654465 [Mus musculus]AAY59779.1 beta-defensin 41 [Mus musculus]|eukprot:NP_001034214.1 beta-defensin 130-like precursor [Mus musculus]